MTTLKPQDVVVALKAAVTPTWTFAALSKALGMSVSDVHASVRRGLKAGFFYQSTKDGKYAVRTLDLIEFLTHGVRYAFVPDLGGILRGMPTAYAAKPLKEHFMSSEEPPPVWPDPEGVLRGTSLEPLHHSVPFAAKRDERLYQCLALVDALRTGRARERQIAAQLLKGLLRT